MQIKIGRWVAERAGEGALSSNGRGKEKKGGELQT